MSEPLTVVHKLRMAVEDGKGIDAELAKAVLKLIQEMDMEIVRFARMQK